MTHPVYPLVAQVNTETVAVKAPNTPELLRGVEGVLTDTHGEPLVGANIWAQQGQKTFETSTDHKGRFTLVGLAAGRWQWAAGAPGYHRLERTIMVPLSGMAQVSFQLQKMEEQFDDIIVRSRRAPREGLQRTLNGKQAAQIAGTLGDPVLALENLPGVAQAGSPGAPPIRGSSPQDTLYYVEGIGILNVTHVGSFRSIFPAKHYREY